jgi:predicted RNase H-like nuclease (RuvC/YqgF family)
MMHFYKKIISYLIGDKMSEDLIKENQSLKNELKQFKASLNVSTSQLDAHREQMNESLNLGLQLRTNVILLKKENQLLSKEIESRNKIIAEFQERINQYENSAH